MAGCLAAGAESDAMIARQIVLGVQRRERGEEEEEIETETERLKDSRIKSGFNSVQSILSSVNLCQRERASESSC